MKRTPFVIDGKEFYGAKAAARYKGCSVSAIYKARKRNKIERIGIIGARSYRVMSAGRIYESPSECAKANNVSVSTVYKALADLREDYIGQRSNPNYSDETAEYFTNKAKSQ